MARFPFHKTFDGFDRKAQPSIDPTLIKALATVRFAANSAYTQVLGLPGVGNTRISVALGLEAFRVGLRVVLTTAAALLTTIGNARTQNRLEERIRILTQPTCLMIDEIDDIPAGGRETVLTARQSTR